jgi:hypothetical protein
VTSGRSLQVRAFLLPFAVVLAGGLLTAGFQDLLFDVRVYEERARNLLAGRLPYLDFDMEYPPLSLLPMLLPGLPPGIDQAGYRAALVVENAVLAGIIGLVVLALALRGTSLVGPARAIPALVMLLVPLAPLAAWRFDLAAVTLGVLGILAAVQQRGATAGILLAAGAMTKVFPAAFVPILCLWMLSRGQRGTAARMLVAFGVAVAAVMIPFALIGGRESLAFVEHQAERGLQIESLGASLVLLWHMAIGLPVATQQAFGATDLEGPMAEGLASLSAPLTGLLVIVVGVASLAAFRRVRDASPSRAGGALLLGLCAVVLAVLVGNKVLSPQYMLWLWPFAALLPRPEGAVALAAAALTFVIYPLLYPLLVSFEGSLVVFLGVRNGLLIVLLLSLLIRLAFPSGVAGSAGRQESPARAG